MSFKTAAASAYESARSFNDKFNGDAAAKAIVNGGEKGGPAVSFLTAGTAAAAVAQGTGEVASAAYEQATGDMSDAYAAAYKDPSWATTASAAEETAEFAGQAGLATLGTAFAAQFFFAFVDKRIAASQCSASDQA